MWIVVSGQGTLDAAIQALKLGAFDFICKPLQSVLQLQTAVANAARHRALLVELTERQVAEAALRDSERQLRQLVENLPELAWSTRSDGYIDFYSRRWYDYTGSTFEQTEGWGWKSVVRPDMRDAVIEAWKRSLSTGEPFEMEVPMTGANGTVRWFLTRMRPLRDADGNITRWFGVSTDIDEVRRAHVERERLVADLQNAIAARDEFLSIAAHELRTPLNVLQLQLEGTSHLIRRRSGPENAKFLAKLDVAIRQALHLSTLVDGLLDFSRSALGRLRLDPEQLDLVAIVRDVITKHAQQTQAAGCSLGFEADPEVIGYWDGARLEQVVTHLISNSIKYGNRRPIEVSVTAIDGWARLVVRDHGIGIRPRDLGRVFGRFERAVSSTHYGGLGLGLHIARQIVEAHGGTIDVASELGEGATFTVNLRMQPESHARGTPHALDEATA
jgi:PAS domain S-box-containing protein